ncbi:hypothetical protein MD484_g1011, partial [Candolleomyces efflorescens]
MAASTSVLSKAHNFYVGGNIQVNSPQYVYHTRDQSIDGMAQLFSLFGNISSADSALCLVKGWKMLLENMASNALYNSRARFDPPKCDEDTRVEVIGELMDWMNDREGPQRLLCMTGAAGAGKSALQQTISERCAKSGILGCAFFFSSQDPTRNNLSRIIPTIAFQLGQKDPRLREYVSRAVEDDPPIFDKDIRAQMDTLVVGPFQQLCADGGFDGSKFPHAILIDGLDECSGEEKQEELLSTIKHCLLDNNLPFRIFIASRPEWAIRTALNPELQGYLHSLAYHIQLSDKYDATNDIRRFLWRRLQAIGSRSSDPRARSRSWPLYGDIEKLVLSASGQFVYAATIVKYVSERRSSPVDRLQTVLDWTPENAHRARPFEALDILYTGILTAAKESYEAVDTNQGHSFLLVLRTHHVNSDDRTGTIFYADHIDDILDLEKGTHEIIVSDLHSLVAFRADNNSTFVRLQFYHRSFSEFLDSKIRSKNLFISETEVKSYVSEAILRRISQFTLNPSSSGGNFEIIALHALVLYSNKGEILSGPQIQALVRHGREYIDKLVPHMQMIVPEEGYREPEALEMIVRFMERLRDELDEPDLANTLKSYYHKWRKLAEKRTKESQQAALDLG